MESGAGGATFKNRWSTLLIRRRERRVYPVGYVPEPIRHMEILRYLKDTNQQERPWVALEKRIIASCWGDCGWCSEQDIDTMS